MLKFLLKNKNFIIVCCFKSDLILHLWMNIFCNHIDYDKWNNNQRNVKQISTENLYL